jgi:hypothetical protein
LPSGVNPGTDDDRAARLLRTPVQIGARPTGGAPKADRDARRLRRRFLQPARPVAGGDIGQQVARFLAPRRHATRDAQRNHEQQREE